MKSSERATIYSLIMLVLIINGIVLFVNSSPEARADSTLSSAMGFSDEYTFAFVDVNKTITALMETSRFKDDREALTEEIQGEEDEWRARFAELNKKYEGITPDSPNFEEASNAFTALNASFSQWRQSAEQRVNEMAVIQLEKAYREVVDAVNIVADDKEIDIVFRFTPTEDPLPTGMSGQTMLDIRMRPVLRYPDEVDITIDVLDELGIDSD